MHAGMGHPQDYRLEDFLARTNQANTSPRGCSPTDIRRRCATERSGAIPPVCTALKPIKHPAQASSVAALCAALGAELRCGELPLKRGCLLASVASHPFPQVCHRDVARVPCAAFGLPALGPLSVPHTPIF